MDAYGGAVDKHESGVGEPQFDGPGHTPAIVSPFVLGGEEPIRMVTHHDDGTWSFCCGTTDEADHFVTVHAEHMFRRFGYDLFHLRDLPQVYIAERDAPGDAWLILAHEEAET